MTNTYPFNYPIDEFRQEVRDKLAVAHHSAANPHRTQTDIIMQQCEDVLVEQAEELIRASLEALSRTLVSDITQTRQVAKHAVAADGLGFSAGNLHGIAQGLHRALFYVDTNAAEKLSRVSPCGEP